MLGSYKLLHVALDADSVIHVRCDRMIHYPIGARIRFDLDAQQVRFFDATTEKAIGVTQVAGDAQNNSLSAGA
jgi:hypothetical protein